MKSNMQSRIQFNFQAIVLWTVYSCVICAANAAQITQTKGVVKPKATPKTEKADKKAPELVIQTGTGGSIENVAISPDGKTIATGDFNGAIRLWDKDSGQLMRLLENHQNNLRRLDFSADGKTLFSSDIWGQVLSWNLTTGTSQVVVNINAIRTPSFAPDQKTIVINSRDKLQFFDRSGKLIRSLPALNSNANIAISPDGSEILAGWWEKLQLVDAQTGSVKREFMSEGARVNSIEYSPDGKQFAVARQAEYPNGIVEIRDAKSGQLAGSLNSENLSYAITYAPNGQSIAIGADIYSVPDLKPLGSMRRYRTEYVNDNVFSGDGKTLLVSSDDTFRLLNAADGKVLRKWEGVQSRPLSAAYSADGTRFALGLDAGGASCVWNLKPFSLQRYFANTGGMLNSVVFSRESKRLGIRPQFDLKQSGDIEFWNLDHPDRWSETNANFFRDATALALSPDGKNIAITSRMRAVNLAFDNGKELSPLGKEWDGIKALVWSQDSTTLTTVQDERSATIKRWTPNGTETFSVEIEGGMRNFYDEDGNRSPDSGVFAISPDTKQVAGVRLKTKQTQLCLWNTTTGKVTQTFDLPAKQIKVMSFSPNAQLLVIGDEQGIVSIFDLKAKTQRVIEAHLERITALTWSPRGSRLVTNSADGKSKFWDTSSTRLLATLWVLKDSQAEGRIISDGVQQAEAPKWILFTPEGYYMASPQAEPYLRWRVGDQLLPATAFSTKFRNQKTVEKAIAEN